MAPLGYRARRALPISRTTVEPVRPPEARRILRATAVIVTLVLAGCGSSEDPPVEPSVTAAPTPSGSLAPTSVTVPVDGVTLRSLGYLNGPAEQFTLPRTALISAAVDQENNVTAVLTQPPPTDVEAYLRRALPATGFAITADNPDAPALTFSGHGWTGSFTANDATSAVLLRPA